MIMLTLFTAAVSVSFGVLIRRRENALFIYKKYLLPVEGRIGIGKNPQNPICYDALNRVSGNHAVLEVGKGGCFLRDLSKNGVYVNHMRIQDHYRLRYGDTINIVGLKMVFLGSFLAIDTQMSNLKIAKDLLYPLRSDEIADALMVNAPEKQEETERKYFHRIPRILEQMDTEAFALEAPPGKEHNRKNPWYLTIGPSLTMAIPMSLGCILSIIGSGNNSSVFMYTGLVTAFGSAIIGASWGAARLKYDKKRRREEEEHRLAAYQEYLDESEGKIRERYETDERILRNRYVAADYLCAQGGAFAELWSRNTTHPDFLYHRLGTGSLPFPSEVAAPQERFMLYKDDLVERPRQIKEKYKNMQDVPVGIDLWAHPLVGIVGGQKKLGAYEILKSLLVQIAANNCYTDVKIALTYDEQNLEERQAFELFRWLPHMWSQDRKTRYMAGNPVEIADVYYALTQILRQRAEGDPVRNVGIPKPVYVLVVGNLESLNNELISRYLFQPLPSYGLITILLVEDYEELPNECEYIISNRNVPGSFVGAYSVRGEEKERREIVFDKVSNQSVEAFARSLSSYEVEELETGGDISSSITFFEMMGISNLGELDVLNRWKKNRTYDSMRALLGQKAGGAPCYLDVHEKYHGPHGLVAGTTGSGKSETLQTYMLSLAINFSPDDIGFFIIDYKGGGMANLFNGLPHLMGQISNLSGNQVHRAMVSIKSENRRRQRVFNESGVNNINSYTKLYKNNEVREPVPHLFIIIDEFAELKREEPDFMRELISVAQVGRSLGVHLILATQKPSGTVDDNIWSNSKFRICLRVQDRQDSSDMLHKPDAAYITQAGRGYLQVGNDELYELFQSGFSGATYDESGSEGKTETVKMYTMHGHTAIVGNRLKMYRQEKVREQWLRKLTEAAEELFADGSVQCSVDNFGVFLENRGIDCPANGSNRQRMENLLLLCAEAAGRTTDGRVHYVMTESVKRGLKLPETKEKTQLDAVVAYLADIAAQNGFSRQFLLWLPVLPEMLYLDQLAGFKETGFRNGKWQKPQQWELKAIMGLMDDPENQAQMPLELDFGQNGHHLLFGSIGTGRSTFLQTLAYSLIHRYSPEYVNLYCMDFSSNSLRAYEKSAHVGALCMRMIWRRFHAAFICLMECCRSERRC
ncbi:MAG: FHA domain-containing protein [Clostridiales bacterium]|nr:FHA domain-containing protein [Clostridiales bacterium]